MAHKLFNSLLGPANSFSLKINSGGSAERGWVADTGYTGGSVYDFTDTSLHRNSPGYYWAGVSAPTTFANAETIYRYQRYRSSGAITYVISGLTPSVNALVRIHVYCSTAYIPIQQQIKINGSVVEATNSYTDGLVIKEFVAAADGSGQMTIEFSGGIFSGVSGIVCKQPVPASPRRSVLFCCGDSLTDSRSLVGATHTWPYLIANRSEYSGNVTTSASPNNGFDRGYDEDAAWTFRMIAQGGHTISTQTSQIDPYITSTSAARLWDRRVMFISCGTNDLSSGRTSAQMISDMQTFFSTLPAGITKTGIGTVTKRGETAPQQTAREAFNTWVLANSLGCDFVVDFASDTRLADNTNLTYFDPDGIHQTATGQAVRAELVLASMNSVGL